MEELKFEFIFAVIAFATTRYAIPWSILKKKIDTKELIVLSVCYGLCSYLRRWAREQNNKLNETN